MVLLGSSLTMPTKFSYRNILSQLQHVNRVDVVWDLKDETRSKRGNGVRRRVEPCNAIPGNWQEFLRIDNNKAELFSYLYVSP